MTRYLKMMAASAAVAMAAAATTAAANVDSPTLAEVLERGKLNCTGHNGSYLGFAEVDDQGKWKGMDIEMCRAVATAIFGDPEALNIVPLSWAQRWPALQSGEVDLVIKASGGTFSRDTELGLQFSRPYFFGTTKIMFHKELGLTEMAEADGGTVCIPAGTTIERQVASYADRLGIKIEPALYEKTEELREAYYSKRCDAYAQWGPTVAIARTISDNPEDHEIMPDVLAVEPEVALVRQGDDDWLDVINWVFSALWFAEQEGISSENVDEIKANPPTAEIGKMLGATPGVGGPLGLQDDWGYNVIKMVGNYAEIYDRTLGKDSPYDMPRDLNKLWSDGGVHYPMVFD